MGNNPGGSFLIIVIILAVMGTIAVAAFIIYRLLHPKLKQDKPTEEDKQHFVEEELNRYLKPIEDEETAKQISEYKDDED